MTSRSTWKRREREAAAKLGGERIPVSGRGKGEPDAETPLLVIQAKHGRNRPGYLKDWLSGIVAHGKARNKVGIVVWSVGRERSGEALVLLRLSDFEALHGRLPKATDEQGKDAA